MNTRISFKTLMLSSAAAVAFASGPVALAVDMPAGTKLHASQELTLNNNTEVTSIDPAKMGAEPAFNIGKDLFDGLVSQDKTGQIIPALATHWEASDANKTYTFHLREGAKWSNGDPITAADFVYSFRRLMAPETASPYGWFAEMAQLKNGGKIIKGELPPESLGVEALDAHTLRFTLESPIPFFVKMLSHPVMFPVHPATVDANGDSWTRPNTIVSNGPFKLADWVVNEKVVLVKNENYWNAKDVVLEKVTFLPITDPNIALKRYLAGEIDVLNKLPTAQLKRLREERPQEIKKIEPSLQSTYYALNTKMAPTDDVRVRKALAYAVNRDVLTQAITANGEIPMYGLTPPQVDGFAPLEPSYAKMTQQEREAEAKRLLVAAGYSAAKPLQLSMVIPSYSDDQKMALALSNMWKSVLKANVTIEKLEPKVFYATKTGHHIYRGGWVADYNEASTFLDIFNSEGSGPSQYNNAEYDALLKEAKTSVESSSFYQKAEEKLTTDFPLVPLYRPGYQDSLSQPYVGGYDLTNPEQNYYRRDVYIIAH
jgi:oligopeptide transport system substrate-binding protein